MQNLRWTAFFLVPVAVFGATVRGVSYDPASRMVTITVESDTEPTYKDFELADPDRVVLDLEDAVFPANKFEAPVGDGLVARIRAAQNSIDPAVTRIVVDLESGVSGYTVGVTGSAPTWSVNLTAIPAGDVLAVEQEARRIEEATLEPRVLPHEPPTVERLVFAHSPTPVLESPAENARRVSEGLAGERVESVAELGGWRLVILTEQDDLAGWVAFSSLTEEGKVERDDGSVRAVPNPRTPPPGTLQTPQPGMASLRTEASEGSAIIAHLSADTSFRAYRRRKDWYFIRLDDGRAGWVAARYVELETPAGPAEPWRQVVIATAESHLGSPYVWGGTSSSGFDCSGLVWRVFKQNGIEVPRTAGLQYREGQRITREELLPGDLVFFSTYSSGPSHVGIYAGDDRFIQAESSPQGVRYSDLDGVYWRDHIYGYSRWVP